jgi:hypothetical protein
VRELSWNLTNWTARDRAVGGEHPPLVDGRGMPGDRIGDAEPLQYPHAVGVEPNSRTDLAELGGLVVHPHFGSGEPSANAADRPPMPPPTTTTRNDRIATSWPLDSASTSFNGNGRYGSRVGPAGVRSRIAQKRTRVVAADTHECPPLAGIGPTRQ